MKKISKNELITLPIIIYFLMVSLIHFLGLFYPLSIGNNSNGLKTEASKVKLIDQKDLEQIKNKLANQQRLKKVGQKESESENSIFLNQGNTNDDQTLNPDFKSRPLAKAQKGSQAKSHEQINNQINNQKNNQKQNHHQKKDQLTFSKLGNSSSNGYLSRVSPVTSKVPSFSVQGKNLSDFLSKNSPLSDNLQSNFRQNQLRQSGVSVQMEVPKGVSIDELNEMEMMFYTFQKRSAIQYVHSILRTIDSYELKYPHLKFPLTKQKERLLSKLTFDENGNVVRIQILSHASSEQLAHFFETVLRDMGSLPNPPRALFKASTEFSILYALAIDI